MSNLARSHMMALCPKMRYNRLAEIPKNRFALGKVVSSICLLLYGGLNTGFIWVLENLESPGILLWHFPSLESPGKRLQVPENPGNLLNSSNKFFRMYIKRNDCKTLGRIDFEIVGVRGCKVKFGVLENPSES